MEVFKLECPNCGANLQQNADTNIFLCPYCNKKIILNELSEKAKIEIQRMEHEEKQAVEKMKHESEMQKKQQKHERFKTAFGTADKALDGVIGVCDGIENTLTFFEKLTEGLKKVLLVLGIGAIAGIVIIFGLIIFGFVACMKSCSSDSDSGKSSSQINAETAIEVVIENYAEILVG